ncbi:MAG: sialidase family protein [Sphaerochaeta sp.]|nr:sialidase family protein [Sphaerochaeta sp.]
MKNYRHSTLVKNEMYNSFPSIARSDDGKLVMVFRQADNSLKKYGAVTHVDPSSCVAMKTSLDDGETWSDSRIIYNDEMGEQDPCLVCLADGTLICTFFRWRVVPKEEKGLLGPAFAHYGRIVFDTWAAMHVGTSCIRSNDSGETWYGPWQIAPTGFEGPAAMRGNIVELPNGKLLAPLYGAKKLGDLSSCLIMGSDDQGCSWHPIGEVPGKVDRHFLEPFLYLAPSGRLDILMRTQLDFLKSSFDKTYLNLHVSSSDDGGRIWSNPQETNLFCPNPVHVLSLENNQALVTFGQRRDPKGIEAILVDAENPQFEDAKKFMVRSAESGDLGYTSAVVLQDGAVLIVYYMTDTDGDACIGSTKVEFKV